MVRRSYQGFWKPALVLREKEIKSREIKKTWELNLNLNFSAKSNKIKQEGTFLDTHSASLDKSAYRVKKLIWRNDFFDVFLRMHNSGEDGSQPTVS
jgi:hypothetical protein